MAADGSPPLLTEAISNGNGTPAVADVIRAISAGTNLSDRRRTEITSALRTICAWLDSEPASVPANPLYLRKRFGSLTPASLRVSRGRFANVRSLVLQGLKRAGIKVMPGRAREPLALDWEALRARLPDRRFQSGLSRLMSYCTAHHIPPQNVDAAVFESFGKAYENDSLLRDPAAMYRDTAKLWNRAATTIPDWPALKVEVRDRRRVFALPLEEFPNSFQADLAAYLSAQGEPDVFDDGYHKPIRPKTLERKRQNILMAATALVRSGFPIEAITGLNILVDSENVKPALKFLLARKNGERSGYLHQIATELKTVAKRSTGASEQDLDRLRTFCRRLCPQQRGFTEKNRRFLRQFEDLNNLAAVLLLPSRLIREAEKRKIGPRRRAVAIELALAIAIELVVPVRVDTLTGLQCERNLQMIGDKVFLLAHEAKNDESVEAELPRWLAEMLALYIREYRPRLLKAASPWLFPGENGERRATGGFSTQISDLIRRETGIVMTVHQFRHLAAKLYLDRHPADYETVRRLLGHKSEATTRRFYHEFNQILAVRLYGGLVTELLAQLEAKPALPRRTRRRHEGEGE